MCLMQRRRGLFLKMVTGPSETAVATRYHTIIPQFECGSREDPRS